MAEIKKSRKVLEDFCKKEKLRILFRDDGITVLFSKNAIWFIESFPDDPQKEFVYFFYCYCQDKYIEKGSLDDYKSLTVMNNELALKAVGLANVESLEHLNEEISEKTTKWLFCKINKADS